MSRNDGIDEKNELKEGRTGEANELMEGEDNPTVSIVFLCIGKCGGQ